MRRWRASPLTNARPPRNEYASTPQQLLRLLGCAAFRQLGITGEHKVERLGRTRGHRDMTAAVLVGGWLYRYHPLLNVSVVPGAITRIWPRWEPSREQAEVRRVNASR